MDLFEYRDYKAFVRDWVRSQPKKGRGQFRLMAEALRVGSVMISQVFKGERNLSLEQAYDLSEFLGLSPIQQRFFVLLVEYGRAGSFKLKRHFGQQLSEIEEKSRELKNRVSVDQKISSKASAQFYSSWIYSAVRLATSIQGYQTREALSQRLGISKRKIGEAVEFLLSQGLCVEKGGKITMGARSTHLGADSPLISRMHSNWRLRAMNQMDEVRSHEIFYSSPVSISKEDLHEVRKQVVELVEKFGQTVKPSPPETLACLNIDWFSF